MKRKTRNAIMVVSLLSIIFSGLFLPDSARAIQLYNIEVIGATQPWRINRSGDVAGWTSVKGLPRGFIYTAEDGLIILPSLPGGSTSIAMDITDRDQTGRIEVVGESHTAGGNNHAVRWLYLVGQGIEDTTDLGTLEGDIGSSAEGINNNGEIVGFSSYPRWPGAAEHAFIHNDADGMIDLTVPGFAEAVDINDSGMVVGNQMLSGFRWTIGEGVEFLIVPDGFYSGTTNAINEGDQIAGTLRNGSGTISKVARYADGIGWRVLGGLGSKSIGWGINTSGDVVGETMQSGVIFTDQLDTLVFLNNFLIDPTGAWRIYAADDINDSGQIVARGLNGVTFEGGAVLLTPTHMNMPPVAAASASTVSGTAPLTVNFSSQDSYDPEGEIMTYAWDFGDESISTAANPSHTYAEALDFTATLTVTDSQGADSNAAVSITVLPDSPLPNEPPIAVAYADILSGTVPLTVNFSSQGSYDPEGGTMTYAWDFGDGSISTAANPSHTYAEALDFTAMLTLTDNQGAEAYDSLSITVLPDGSNGCISYCLISSSIDLTTTEKRRAVTVKGKVFIEDEHGSLIAGATVHGIWTLPDGTSKEQSVDTNQKGIANFRVRAKKGSYTLDIIDTTKTGYSFDPDNSVLSGSIDK